MEYHRLSGLNTKKHKSKLVLEMCEKLNAGGYVFGAMENLYANEEAFTSKGIKIYFQDYKHPEYSQLYGKFEQYMGVIDLLFNCGEKTGK